MKKVIQAISVVRRFYVSISGLAIFLPLTFIIVGLLTSKVITAISLGVLLVTLPYRMMRESEIISRQHTQIDHELTTITGSITAITTEQSQSNKRIDQLNQAVGDESQKLWQTAKNLKNETTHLETKTTLLFETTKNLSDETANLRETAKNLKKETTHLETKTTALNSQQKFLLGQQKFLLGETNQPFPRFLEKDELEAITNYWNKSLDQDFSLQYISWLATNIQATEKISLGRFASTLSDVISRVLITRSVQKSDMELLEIGTLFGIASILIHETIRPFSKSLRSTVIDPFDGYYKQGELDKPTGLPISLSTFDKNLRISGVERSEFRILQGFSNSNEILEKASERKYQVIVVDGDHSYEGVKSDVELYTPLLDDGGVLIIDDYGTPDWPDITAYIDELVEEGTYQILGHYSRTCALKPL